MPHEHLDGLRRSVEDGETSAPEPVVFRSFVEAVMALVDDPHPENVERYLVASRALEGSGSRRKPRLRRAA